MKRPCNLTGEECIGSFITFLRLCCAVGIFYLLFSLSNARGQTNPNCAEFGFQIATQCCCTNDCCLEAEPGEFQHIGGDIYRSNVTGQLVNRTGWSPDGRTIKCACDLGDNGRWVKHQKANVRCLWVPLPSS